MDGRSAGPISSALGENRSLAAGGIVRRGVGCGDRGRSVAQAPPGMRKQRTPPGLRSPPSLSDRGTRGDLLRGTFSRARRARAVGKKFASSFPGALSSALARRSCQDRRIRRERGRRDPLPLCDVERGTGLNIMQAHPPPDSTFAILGEPEVCGQCQSISRLTNGLCLNCLLRGALAEDETPPGKDAFKEVLAGVKSRDGDWHIADHDILHELALAGMGGVYQAREPHSDRIVAIMCVLAYQGDADRVVA